MKREQAQPATAVAKHNEVFAEQARFRRPAAGFDVLGKRHRPPVAPEHFAARRARAHPSQQLVFFV
jgi:hypothetical protein